MGVSVCVPGFEQIMNPNNELPPERGVDDRNSLPLDPVVAVFHAGPPHVVQHQRRQEDAGQGQQEGDGDAVPQVAGLGVAPRRLQPLRGERGQGPGVGREGRVGGRLEALVRREEGVHRGWMDGLGLMLMDAVDGGGVCVCCSCCGKEWVMGPSSADDCPQNHSSSVTFPIDTQGRRLPIESTRALDWGPARLPQP